MQQEQLDAQAQLALLVMMDQSVLRVHRVTEEKVANQALQVHKEMPAHLVPLDFQVYQVSKETGVILVIPVQMVL
ncbi:hypothetical protein [Salmonella sp. s51944]|uniref:hypothetical protein n=1 Tax=unclassified Salmonella TaxID=2614656 RepID=UPI0039812044